MQEFWSDLDREELGQFLSVGFEISVLISIFSLVFLDLVCVEILDHNVRCHSG